MRISRIILVSILSVLCCGALTAHAADAQSGVKLKDGTYPISVTSSSSMFRVVDAQLTAKDGVMSAVLTLSGKGYEKLFMGTGEEALAGSDSDYIYFAEDDGKYTYTVPVAALDQEINCAAWSIRKEKWYDRTLVFESASLDVDAFAASQASPLPLIAGGAAVTAIIAAGAVIVVTRRKASAKSV